MDNLSGRHFGKLKAIRPAYKNGKRNWVWFCECDCGEVLYVAGAYLTNGHTKSCGCWKNQVAATLIRERSLTHGASKTRLYAIWCQMRRRCSNPKDSSYQWYGAKGISVCPDWNDYSTFSAWAIHNGYEMNLTLDRVNPKGNYSPDNCQWITNAENVSRARKEKTGKDVTDDYRKTVKKGKKK